MTDITASIGHPATDRKEVGACGCVVRGGGARVRCAAAEGLWRDLLAARDAVAADPRRSVPGKKARRDAFADGREAYWAHLRRAS